MYPLFCGSTLCPCVGLPEEEKKKKKETNILKEGGRIEVHDLSGHFTTGHAGIRLQDPLRPRMELPVQKLRGADGHKS